MNPSASRKRRRSVLNAMNSIGDEFPSERSNHSSSEDSEPFQDVVNEVIDFGEYPDADVLSVDSEDEVIDYGDVSESYDSSDNISKRDGIEPVSECESLAEELLKFMILFNCSRSMMSYLLTILLKHGVDVPSSVYKLKKHHKKQSPILTVTRTDKGNFAYLSILDNILYSIKRGILHLKKSFTKLKIQICIDGMPVFKSSRLQIWPILLRIIPFPNEYDLHNAFPLPVAVFSGLAKPELGPFVAQLIEELNRLKTEFFLDEVSGRQILISDVYFIADAPARAFLQGIVNHGGYHGCAYCKVEGIYFINHVIYEEIDCPVRRDEAYAMKEENNQHCLSPLAKIVPLRSAFPIDYMHNICIGIVKKCLTFFLFKPRDCKLPCKIPESNKKKLSEHIKYFSKFLPSEFNRKLRGINDFNYYKATELRTFLLYFFPAFMKDYIPKVYYEHFLFLHFGTYSLLTERAADYADVADVCFKRFFVNLKTLYGRGCQVYNMHILLHIAEFARIHGCLDNFSAFCSENYLRLIKKKIKSGNLVFEQVINNLTTLREMYSLKEERKLIYSTKSPNNCCVIASGQILLIDDCHEDGLVSGYIFEHGRDLYTVPYPSLTHKIGSYVLSKKIVRKVAPVNKCICIPLQCRYMIFPFASKQSFC